MTPVSPISNPVPVFKGAIPSNYSGVAQLKAASGRIFKGLFEKGNFVEGSIKLNERISFHGKFANSKAYGQCSVTFANGVSFKGQVEQGEFVGPITFNNGAIYEGGLKNFQFSGKGTLRMAQGMYEGEFQEGEFHGRGQLALFGEGIYKGIFEMSELVDGVIYKGELKNFKPHGIGNLTLTNGEVFKGEFKEGRFYNGIWFNADRTKLEVFENGEVI